jgi:lysophospholipase L1-like esterase
MIARMRRAIVGAVLLLLLAAAPAGAYFGLSADTSEQPGQIGFFVSATELLTRVDIAEKVGGTTVPLRSVVPSSLTGLGGQVFSAGYYPDVVQWRCDRLTRTFTATGYASDGSTVTADFQVDTPSCRNRFALIAPRQVRPGTTVHVRVRDEFELGHTSARVCVRTPGRGLHCRIVRLIGTVTSVTFVAPRGHSVVSLTTPYERVRTVVSAGVRPPADAAPLPVVLATGDSMMQSVDAQLSDTLTGRADVRADVHDGSGLSSNAIVSWAKLPARQMRRFHPQAVVLFLGTNDAYPMTTPAGVVVHCCGEAYIAEYARRVRRTTRTYLRRGGKAVIWLNIPAVRDALHNPFIAAIDEALPRGVAGISGAEVLNMAGLFTPGGVYRDSIKVNGRTVRVRQSDGVHLSPQGATIAADAVVQELGRLGVI